MVNWGYFTLLIRVPYLQLPFLCPPYRVSYDHIHIPGTKMTSIFEEGQPPQNKAELPIKNKGHLGSRHLYIFIYIYISYIYTLYIYT